MCRSKAEGGRRCSEVYTGSRQPAAPGRQPGTGPAARGPRLTPRRLDVLRQATAHPKGGIPADRLTAQDEEALEQLGYAASIDDCGHVNPDSQETEHRFHPHFYRITPAGRAAVAAAAASEHPAAPSSDSRGPR